MKMTRSKLKGIVKECLVEILSEGIGGTESLRESVDNTKKKRDLYMKNEKDRLENHRKSLNRKIDQTVKNITPDPVMRDILADTARTTLQEQMSHDGGPNNSQVSDPGINLDGIFSGAANNWSQLAFTDQKNS